MKGSRKLGGSEQEVRKRRGACGSPAATTNSLGVDDTL